MSQKGRKVNNNNSSHIFLIFSSEPSRNPRPLCVQSLKMRIFFLKIWPRKGIKHDKTKVLQRFYNVNLQIQEDDVKIYLG